MTKSELMKLLMALSNREMKENAVDFRKKLEDAGLEKLDIRNRLDAKKGLKIFAKALSLEEIFDEIELDDEKTDEALKENMMDIYLSNLRRKL